MAVDDDDNVEIDETEQSPARIFTILFVGIVLFISLSLFIFYSTVRSKCIGISTGYLKAIETAYQTGEYRIDSHFPNNKFETGIYSVHVSKILSKSENGPIIIRIEIKDKFFNITHYSEELKLIPLLDIEQQKQWQ